MLRITIHEDDATWQMKLEGKLSGAWVGEAESVWNSSPAAKRRKVDVRDVITTDDAGRRLLSHLHRAGAKLISNGVAMNCLVDEIRHGLVKGILTIAFVIFSAMLPLRAQDAPVRLTLRDAVAIALKQNPEVAIANLNLAESTEDRNIARSALLPQVSLKASDEVIRGNIQALLGTRIPGFPAHNGPFWVIQAGPEFSTPLFDLTLWRRWQAARESVNAAAAEHTTARELNAQLVVSQYLAGLRASADVEAAKSRLDLAQALFELATDMQKNGVGTGIDTLRAHVQFQNETQRYTESQTQLKIALFGLNRLLNLAPERTIELADSSRFFETPSFDSDNSLARAFEARPEIKAVRSQIRVAGLEKKAAQSERLPRLSVSGGWTLEGVSPTTMIPAYQYTAGVQIPLFTGGRIQAQTAIADIEIRKLTQTEQEIRNRIALEVKTAIAQLESARTEVEAANLGVELAKESVTQARDRFRAGVANNIEVITAQDELARANDNQITALYRYNQARADLAHATGQMESLYAK